MLSTLISLTFLLLATMGTAAQADIAWDLDSFGAGSVMVMESRQGALTHVSRGMSGGRHVFDVYDAGQRVGLYRTDARGGLVESVAFDGAVTQFTPSRCNRTLGACRYVVTHPDGLQEARLRVTEQTRDGLRYRVYGSDGLLREGGLTLDAHGAAKRSWTRDALGDGRKQSARRVALSLRQE